MIALTEQARRRLDVYLSRVRESLRSIPSVDGDEVAADLIEHVNDALSGCRTPVSLEALDQVLARLGPPEQWMPAVERPWWRRTLNRLDAGPSDWRLASLSFALLVVGLMTFQFVGPAPLVAATLLSRASMAIARDRNEPLGARSWLLYPAPALFALCVSLAALFGPLYPAWLLVLDPGLANLEDINAGVQGSMQIYYRTAVFVPIFLGISWLLLGLLAVRAHRELRWLLSPAADWLQRRHGVRLAWIGFGLILAGVTVLVVG